VGFWFIQIIPVKSLYTMCTIQLAFAKVNAFWAIFYPIPLSGKAPHRRSKRVGQVLACQTVDDSDKVVHISVSIGSTFGSLN